MIISRSPEPQQNENREILFGLQIEFSTISTFVYTCSNKSLNLLGGPKVYDVSTYLDDHPGGAEVILDVAGKDADEFFEDIGHSNDARDELAKHCIGVLKLSEADIEKRRLEAEKKKSGAGGGSIGPIAVLVAVAAAGYYYYKTNLA